MCCAPHKVEVALPLLVETKVKFLLLSIARLVIYVSRYFVYLSQQFLMIFIFASNMFRNELSP